MDQVESPDIVDDFELPQDEAVEIKDKHGNKQKLRRRISQYKVSYFYLFLYFSKCCYFIWSFLLQIQIYLCANRFA